MNKAETRRYAHHLVAMLIEQYREAKPELLHGSPDGADLEGALVAMAEQHRRWGPKLTDHLPRPKPVQRETPLFDEPEPVQERLTD